MLHARELIDQWRNLECELRGDGGEPEGLLRVVVPHAFGQQFLVGPLAGFLRKHPRVNVDWLLHDRRPDFVAEGVDCAIHVGGRLTHILPDWQAASVPVCLTYPQARICAPKLKAFH